MCKRLDELNKSRSLHLNQIAIWTSICKYYAAKVDLNMNSACSARLCMNGAEARFCLPTLHTQPYAASMRTYIYEQYLQNCSESHLMKTSIISYTLRTLKYSRQPIKIKVWLNLLKILC